jgi:hypothetical protein
MVSLREGITNGLRDAYCSKVAATPQWFRNLRRVVTAGDLVSRGDYLNQWICGTPPGGSPALPPPAFSGGQCPTTYRFQVNHLITFPDDSTVESASGIFTALGPISGLGTGPSNGACGAGDPTAAGVNSASGFVVTGCPPIGGSISATSFLLLERVDGQIDSCGDPGPELPPEVGPITTNIDVNYDGDDILNVPVVLAPVYIALDGTVNVPVTIELPDFNLEGTLELFPGFEFTPEFGGGEKPTDTGPEGEPPPSTPDTDPGDTEEPDPEPPDGDPDEPIIAVLCNAVIEPEAWPSGIYQPDGPDIYAPSLGYVRFGTVINRSTFWSADIPLKSLRQVVPCPVPWGARRVAVNAQPGVAINFTVIRSELPEYPPYLLLAEGGTRDNR